MKPGIIFTGLALFGCLDQMWRCNAQWDWSQAFIGIHHETLIMACLCVWVVLMWRKLLKLN